MMEILLKFLRRGEIEMYRAAVEAHRRAGLHPVSGESESAQLFGNAGGGRLGTAATGKLHAANVHQPVQERAVGKHHGAGGEFHAESGFHACDTRFLAIVVDGQAGNGVLPHPQVRRLLKLMTPVFRKPHAVNLGARAPHGGAFRAVEHAELYRCTVGYHAHTAAERINLAHNLTFCYAAYGRIAAHLGYLVQVNGNQQSGCTEPGSRRGSLATGMTGAHYNHIIIETQN